MWDLKGFCPHAFRILKAGAWAETKIRVGKNPT